MTFVVCIAWITLVSFYHFYFDVHRMYNMVTIDKTCRMVDYEYDSVTLKHI